MQQLRSDIQEGLSSGEPTPWKPEEIKQDGRKRKASRRAPTQGALAQGAYAVALTIGLRMGCAVFRWGVTSSSISPFPAAYKSCWCCTEAATSRSRSQRREPNK